MGSKREKRRNQKKRKARQHSALKDHKQRGKVLTAPINQVGPITAVAWLQDVFPSLLWPCAVLHDSGLDRGSEIVAQVLDRLSPLVVPASEDSAEQASALPFLDGTLQGFDLVPEAKRDQAIELLREDGLYESAFPWVLVRALQKYQDVPGSWVFSGWEGNTQIIPEGRPEAFLSNVVTNAWHGQSDLATRAKMLFVRAVMMAGRIHFGPNIEFVQLLPKYPDGLTADERAQVESFMRATFGSMWSRPNDQAVQPASWSASFWRQNWTLYRCRTKERPEPSPSPSSDDRAALDKVRSHWLEELNAIEATFMTALEASDPDLYSPDRNEVLTGITYRQIRAIGAMIAYPSLWDLEHGAAFVRAVVEARIVQKWLISRNDSNLFHRFKDYGRGHMKLHLLHLREYQESVDDAPDGIAEVIESIESYVNRDIMEEFQDIDLGANFAGSNTREMAREVGLEDDYRLVFAPTSADAHGEWMSLEKFALVPCGNPLHRGHRIPNKDRTVQLGPELVDLALSLLNDMVNEYVAAV